MKYLENKRLEIKNFIIRIWSDGQYENAFYCQIF